MWFIILLNLLPDSIICLCCVPCYSNTAQCPSLLVNVMNFNSNVSEISEFDCCKLKRKNIYANISVTLLSCRVRDVYVRCRQCSLIEGAVTPRYPVYSAAANTACGTEALQYFNLFKREKIVHRVQWECAVPLFCCINCVIYVQLVASTRITFNALDQLTHVRIQITYSAC